MCEVFKVVVDRARLHRRRIRVRRGCCWGGDCVTVMPDLFRHPPSRRISASLYAARWTPEQVRGDGVS